MCDEILSSNGIYTFEGFTDPDMAEQIVVREGGLSGDSGIKDDAPDRDLVVGLLQQQLVEAHDKIKELERANREIQQRVTAQHNIIASTPVVPNPVPPTTPTSPTRPKGRKQILDSLTQRARSRSLSGSRVRFDDKPKIETVDPCSPVSRPLTAPMTSPINPFSPYHVSSDEDGDGSDQYNFSSGRVPDIPMTPSRAVPNRPSRRCVWEEGRRPVQPGPPSHNTGARPKVSPSSCPPQQPNLVRNVPMATNTQATMPTSPIIMNSPTSGLTGGFRPGPSPFQAYPPPPLFPSGNFSSPIPVPPPPQHPFYTIPQASPPSVLTTSPPIFRPKDVRELKLSELTDISTPTTLSIFYDGVERCTLDSRERVDVAMLRMEHELRVLVRNACDSGVINTWNDLKAYMADTFMVKLSFDQVFDITNALHYVWTQDPHSFKNSFICQYSAMKSHFRDKDLPPCEKMLKAKLVEGFPSSNKLALAPFMDKSVPMPSFMVQVQRQRELLFHMQGPSPVTLPATPTSSSHINHTSQPVTPDRQGSDTSNSCNGANRPPQGNRRPKLRCYYCHREGHTTLRCRLKPPYNLCFDCKSEQCIRGHPDCPGWRPHFQVFDRNGRRLSLSSNSSSQSRVSCPPNNQPSEDNQ